MSNYTIHLGDALSVLRTMPSESVQTVVTSPPYFGLRDYGVAGQLGAERTPEEYIAAIVAIFDEVYRVMRPDATCWLNLGDSYASNWPCNRRNVVGSGSLENGKRENRPPRGIGNGIKEKELIGIPWAVAFALRSRGFYLRQDIIWSKPNPMPESVKDRCTKAHEYIFLLTKSERYYYDGDAIKEPIAKATISRLRQNVEAQNGSYTPSKGNGNMKAVFPASNRDRSLPTNRNGITGSLDAWNGLKRNKRSVWNVATQPFPEAHFAVFPEKLIEPCVLAGSRENDVVLDPFCGAGTTAKVALKHSRRFIGIELNPTYIEIAKRRIESL